MPQHRDRDASPVRHSSPVRNHSTIVDCECCHGLQKLPLSLMPAMFCRQCHTCQRTVCGYCMTRVNGSQHQCGACVAATGDRNLVVYACCLRSSANPSTLPSSLPSSHVKNETPPLLNQITSLASEACSEADEALYDHDNSYAIDEAYCYLREAMDEILDISQRE